LKKYNKNHEKPIIRSDGKYYDNSYQAAKDLNVTVCSVRNVLKGRNKKCKGYEFKYVKHS
jgi:hypothetical protein